MALVRRAGVKYQVQPIRAPGATAAINMHVGQSSSQHDSAKDDLFCRLRNVFRIFARSSSSVLGSAWAFIGALLIIAIWALTGPMFHFSDTWQLIINTGTTIVTFLMVFLIQNTQNRDAKAVHLKLDELIRALHGARNRLVDLEKLSDEELQKLEQEFERVHKTADHKPRNSHGQKAEPTTPSEHLEKVTGDAGRE
jgi:low affinity Fe/Cu permease